MPPVAFGKPYGAIYPHAGGFLHPFMPLVSIELQGTYIVIKLKYCILILLFFTSVNYFLLLCQDGKPIECRASKVCEQQGQQFE
jgi:hypothetical protein